MLFLDLIFIFWKLGINSAKVNLPTNLDTICNLYLKQLNKLNKLHKLKIINFESIRFKQELPTNIINSWFII